MAGQIFSRDVLQRHQETRQMLLELYLVVLGSCLAQKKIVTGQAKKLVSTEERSLTANEFISLTALGKNALFITKPSGSLEVYTRISCLAQKKIVTGQAKKLCG